MVKVRAKTQQKNDEKQETEFGGNAKGWKCGRVDFQKSAQAELSMTYVTVQFLDFKGWKGGFSKKCPSSRVVFLR